MYFKSGKISGATQREQRMDRKKFFSGIKKQIAVPENIFALALCIAGISTCCTVLFLTDIYRDTAHVYAVFAREIGRGNYFDGIATKVPMLNITLAGLLAHCGMEAVKARLYFVTTCKPILYKSGVFLECSKTCSQGTLKLIFSRQNP